MALKDEVSIVNETDKKGSEREVAFEIRGMDCAEEVASLKREVGALVGGEERLAFDILKGKMTVNSAGLTVGEEEIRRAVARTGMEAVPWTKMEAGRSDISSWSRRSRVILSSASGLMLLAGFIAQTLHDGGVAAALRIGQAASHDLPLIVVLLYLVAVITGIWHILPKAFLAARALRPDMNLLMTVAVAGAIGIGEWFEAAAVTFLFSLALLLETWSVERASKAISSLMNLSPAKARFHQPDSDEVFEAPVEEVPVGAAVLVRPGEKVPLDGVVLRGQSFIDQSSVTGESIPVTKEPGDEVFAGTINGDGAFAFKSTKPASETTLARIIHLVQEAQSRRAPSEQWVERFARIYTPTILALALGVVLFPPLVLGGEWGIWFYNGLVLLVIACPCALVISTPVSIVSSLTTAARSGVLIKGGVYLEAPARWKAIACDKTGTLTYGKPQVQKVIPLNNHSRKELLERAAALEVESSHPLAQAIVKAAKVAGIQIRSAEGLTAIPGKGAEGSILGRRFWIGSHRLAEERGAETEESHRLAIKLEDAGYSLVVIGNDEHICGLIGVADQVRPEARGALAALRSEGISKVVMLTGDNSRTAEAVGERVGIDEVRAELLPEEKVSAVKELAEVFGQVAMVGDGVNDAPALAAASCGIVMGAAGSDAAIDTADIALMSDDLERIPWLVRHSRHTLNIIKQNITAALGVKILFVVLASLGMATLWMAIAADMGMSLLVIANGLRLLR